MDRKHYLIAEKDIRMSEMTDFEDPFEAMEEAQQKADETGNKVSILYLIKEVEPKQNNRQ